MHALIPLRSEPSTSDPGPRQRLFLKGLADETMHTDASVCSLFASFGLRVCSVERYGPFKERVFYRSNGKRVRVRYGRRFAFLDVCPLHETGSNEGGDEVIGSVGLGEGGHDIAVNEEQAFWNAVQKAVRSLNGTTWKGATLRCQLAKERGDERIRREIEEESAREAEETDAVVPVEPAVHEKESVRGENTVRFEEGEDVQDAEVGLDRACLWAEIETPRQWVYNYERHLREVAAQRGGGDGKGEREGEGLDGGGEKDDGDRRSDAGHKSLVERFLEQQDVARAKRREERAQKEKDSFGTVYDGAQEDVRRRERMKRRRGDGRDEEEEERIAVVEFWSDGEEEDMGDVGDVGGRGVGGRAGAVDLSRFDDSESDEAVAMEADDGNGTSEESGSLEDTSESGDGYENDDGGRDGREGGSGERDDENDETSEGSSDDGEQHEDEEDDDEEDDDADEEDDEEESGDDHYATVAKVFPNAASFHATRPMEQAQAALNGQAEGIRTSLKAYRKKARRLGKN